MRDYLLEVKAEVGNIIYAVGDYGSDIKKGLELAQTEFAYIIPPKRRNKSRFQNIGIIIIWAVKVLRRLRGRKIEKGENKVGKEVSTAHRKAVSNKCSDLRN